MTEAKPVALREAPTDLPAAAPMMQAVGEIVSSDRMLAQIDQMAERMASAKNTVPKHLAGNPGDCWAVIMQAIQWRMNPFAVAQKTHIVNGALGYEAQLINAVITSMAPTVDRLNYEWYGDWSGVKGKECGDSTVGVRVWATMKGESEPRVLDVSMAQVGGVRNSPLWVADPRQQLAYLAAKRWARLHCPDVLLGVYTPDELAETREREVTPAKRPADVGGSRAAALKDRLRDASEAPASEQAHEPPTGPTFDEVVEHINAASSPQALTAAGKAVEKFLAQPGNAHHDAALRDVYKARRDALKAERDGAQEGLL